MPDLARVKNAYKRYVEARNALLDELQLGRKSNRDPLAEFSEWLVAALVEGSLASSPVQRGWDVETQDGKKIQVKYLANSAEKWVNEHAIYFTELMDEYALVIFEALLPKSVIIFPGENLAVIGARLNKRHPNLDKTLQFTQANYRQIVNNSAEFESFGVKLYQLDEWLLE